MFKVFATTSAISKLLPKVNSFPSGKSSISLNYNRVKSFSFVFLLRFLNAYIELEKLLEMNADYPVLASNSSTWAKKKRQKVTNITTSDLEKFKQALKDAVQHSIEANIDPLEGTTVIACAFGEELFQSNKLVLSH